MTYLDTLPETKVERALERARSAGFTAFGRNMLEYADGDERFALWLLIADAGMSKTVGVGIFDLADYDWVSAYGSGDSPRQAVRDALGNDDTYSALVNGV